MKHLKYLGALAMVAALSACEGMLPVEQEPTPLPAPPSTERTLQAAAAHAVTVTKQDEQRDRVVVTGPWAEGWYISGVWFDVPNNRKLPPNPLTGTKRNLTVRCDLGASWKPGRGFAIAELPQVKRRTADGFDIHVTVRRAGGHSYLPAVKVCQS